MKKMKKITILITLIILLSTGCTKTLVDKKKNPVKNNETGQNLVQNILCQPTDKKIREQYIKNKVDIDSLPKCDEFKITSGEYEGIWTSVFVKPLAFIILKIGHATKNYGIALILVLLIIRLITYPFTKKTVRQSQLMQEINPEIQRIQKKYAGKQDEESLSKQSQEMMMIYKKYNINPISGCLVSFIQLPIFIAFYEAVQRFPAIFDDYFLTLQLGTTPLVGFRQSNFYAYIILMILIAASTFYSFKMTMSSNQMDPNMKRMPIFMSIMIIVTAFFMPSALCIYWFFNNIFTIIQNKLVKKPENKNNSLKGSKRNYGKI
ncbi:MAG: YidC/Oxa1 family membrane protein insertase [Bacilli bacterium]|nr:YidC/Oxa1 family membrane protein insertase [Bacilli bacterium]